MNDKEKHLTHIAVGAIVGQLAIPIPVVGAVIGGYVGHWLYKK